jgi:hypothetical protein
MTNELITTTDKALAQRLRARVGSLYSLIERDDHYRDALPAPINRAERKELEGYRRDLHARLSPASLSRGAMESVAKAVGVLLQAYVNVRSGDMSATLAAYVAFVQDQPAWAILAAIDDFRQGRVYDMDSEGNKIPFTLDHAPSAPRIVNQVEKHTIEIVEERGKVTRLLAIEKIVAPEVSEEERERVGAHMRRLADSITMKNERIRAAEMEQARGEAQEARERAARIVEEATRRRRADSHAG